MKQAPSPMSATAARPPTTAPATRLGDAGELLVFALPPGITGAPVDVLDAEDKDGDVVELLPVGDGTVL